MHHILKKQQCNLLSYQENLPYKAWDLLNIFYQIIHTHKDVIVTLSGRKVGNKNHTPGSES